MTQLTQRLTAPHRTAPHRTATRTAHTPAPPPPPPIRARQSIGPPPPRECVSCRAVCRAVATCDGVCASAGVGGAQRPYRVDSSEFVMREVDPMQMLDRSIQQLLECGHEIGVRTQLIVVHTQHCDDRHTNSGGAGALLREQLRRRQNRNRLHRTAAAALIQRTATATATAIATATATATTRRRRCRRRRRRVRGEAVRAFLGDECGEIRVVRFLVFLLIPLFDADLTRQERARTARTRVLTARRFVLQQFCTPDRDRTGQVQYTRIRPVRCVAMRVHACMPCPAEAARVPAQDLIS